MTTVSSTRIESYLLHLYVSYIMNSESKHYLSDNFYEPTFSTTFRIFIIILFYYLLHLTMISRVPFGFSQVFFVKINDYCEY